MSFAIIDQGRRVATPLKTLFPDKGVAQTSASEAAHSSTHNEKDLQSENSEFRKIIERATPKREELTPGTYDDLKPTKTPQPKKQSLTAEQIMSTPVHKIVEGTTAHAAWQRMQTLNVSHLMVTDSTGKTVGLLSKIHILALGKDSTQSITNYYCQKIIAGSLHTQVTQIAACFIEFDINALPIFDETENLVGIVCRTDLLRLIISGARIESWA